MSVGIKDISDEAARASRCLARLHLLQDDGILTADQSPENRAWLQAEYPGVPLRFTGAGKLRDAVVARHGEALKREAVEGLRRRLPELSASRVLSCGQLWAFAVLAAALLGTSSLWPGQVLGALVLVLSAALVASGLFRALLAWIGAGPAALVAPLPRCGLPRYTILVPLYREAAMLPDLSRALKALDYPGLLAQVPQTGKYRDKPGFAEI